MVCHNTRYKVNVLQMLDHLRQYNPGKLHHVCAIFQSGPVNKDTAAWLRDERRARSLLVDYGMHRVDLILSVRKRTAQARSLSLRVESGGRDKPHRRSRAVRQLQCEFPVPAGPQPAQRPFLFQFSKLFGQPRVLPGYIRAPDGG